jgi:hypothetical protein
MGTRSLLGYDLGNGKLYVQYMQFDGYPEVRGREYYVEVLRGLMEMGDSIKTKEGKPSLAFFTRIKNYLNEKQYSSGHSIGNHFTVTKEDWEGMKVDCNQAWQYLFTREGDFVFSAHSENRYEVVIPWGFTVKLLEQRESKFLDALNDNEGFWKSLKFEDREENEKVLSWGVDAVLHVNEELNYASSKLLFEMLLRGGSPKLSSPGLKINYGEIMAFPEQGEEGWVRYAFLTVFSPGEPLVEIRTMFADLIRERRGKGDESMSYQHKGSGG